MGGKELQKDSISVVDISSLPITLCVVCLSCNFAILYILYVLDKSPVASSL